MCVHVCSKMLHLVGRHRPGQRVQKEEMLQHRMSLFLSLSFSICLLLSLPFTLSLSFSLSLSLSLSLPFTLSLSFYLSLSHSLSLSFSLSLLLSPPSLLPSIPNSPTLQTGRHSSVRPAPGPGSSNLTPRLCSSHTWNLIKFSTTQTSTTRSGRNTFRACSHQ